MKKHVMAVRPYRHHPKHKFQLELHAFGRGRKFFKTRAEADAACLRQKTLLERYSREAVGLPQREMRLYYGAEQAGQIRQNNW